MAKKKVPAQLETFHSDDLKEAMELRDAMPQLDAVENVVPQDHLHHQNHQMRELIVEIMKLSLYLWEMKTHKTKIELAEESGIWKASIDGSSLKTRTLDRYFNLKTLPKKPRWREVLRTAYYVLNHCDLSDEQHQQLKQMVDQLEVRLLDYIR